MKEHLKRRVEYSKGAIPAEETKEYEQIKKELIRTNKTKPREKKIYSK